MLLLTYCTVPRELVRIRGSEQLACFPTGSGRQGVRQQGARAGQLNLSEHGNARNLRRVR